MGNTLNIESLPRVDGMSVERQQAWRELCYHVWRCGNDESGDVEEEVKRHVESKNEEHPGLCVAVDGRYGSLLHLPALKGRTDGLVRCVWRYCRERALQVMRYANKGGFTALHSLALNPNMTRGMYFVFAKHCSLDDFRATNIAGWTVLFCMAFTFVHEAKTEEQEENIASIMYDVVQRLGPGALDAQTTVNVDYGGHSFPAGSTPRSILNDAGEKGRTLLQPLQGVATQPEDAEQVRQAGIDTATAPHPAPVAATDATETAPSAASETPTAAEPSGHESLHTAGTVTQISLPGDSNTKPPPTILLRLLAEKRDLLRRAKRGLGYVRQIPGLERTASLAIRIITHVEETVDVYNTEEEIVTELGHIADTIMELKNRVLSTEGGALHRVARTKVERVTAGLEKLASDIYSACDNNSLQRLVRGGNINEQLQSIEENLEKAVSWCTTVFLVTQADGSRSAGSTASAADTITDPLLLLQQEHVAQMRFPPDALQHNHDHRLGSGGFAPVYMGVLRPADAREEHVSERVAIKIISALAFPELLAGLREMERQSNLSHPNVVSLYGFAVTEAALDATSADGQLLIAMELAELGDLHDAIELPSISEAGRVATPNTALTAELRAGFLLQAAEAIDYVHSQGLVHRDIKSHNCVIFHDLTLKLTDFGISREIDAQVTMTQQMGTAGYMAPEVRKHQHYDERADIFSFGVLAGEMLVRCIPAKRMKKCPPPPDDMLRAAVEDVPSMTGAARVGGGQATVTAASAREDPAAAFYGDSDDDEEEDAHLDDTDEQTSDEVQRELWDCMFRIHRECVVASPSERLAAAEILRRLRTALTGTVALAQLPAAIRFRACRLEAMDCRRVANVSGEAVGTEQS